MRRARLCTFTCTPAIVIQALIGVGGGGQAAQLRPRRRRRQQQHAQRVAHASATAASGPDAAATPGVVGLEALLPFHLPASKVTACPSLRARGEPRTGGSSWRCAVGDNSSRARHSVYRKHCLARAWCGRCALAPPVETCQHAHVSFNHGAQQLCIWLTSGNTPSGRACRQRTAGRCPPERLSARRWV